MLFPPSPRELLIALNAAPRISRPAVCRLAQELSRWSEAPEPPGLLAAAVGIPKAQMEKALAVRETAAAVTAREEAEAGRLGARIVLQEDPAWPAGLAHLSLPPPVLYVAGEIPEGPALSIVGSRRSDAYGTEVAETFARALAASGVTVVSGFARGIDAAAHRGALAADGGRTVAVLGCGLGVDYPLGHAKLAKEIAARGALVSEFPCGMAPRAWHFPVRNRVIAALSAGILVVQATPRSGSLITARHSLELGREVYAVPGRIFDERSLGPHALLRDGARLVQHPQDILDDLLPRRPGSPPPGPLFAEPAPALPDPPEGLPREILAVLPPGSFQVPEDLAVRVDAPVDQVLGALLELELGGWVKRMPGSVYGR
ncbi:MAG TPA: DNA-processing protein DprA [Thermoanaerobaculia bacterium]|nr:DNA-processing protein DprA [Thermoanaerobaculia bacterium]